MAMAVLADTAMPCEKEFCIKNEEFSIKNEEFCIKNEELCRWRGFIVVDTGIFISIRKDISLVLDQVSLHS